MRKHHTASDPPLDLTEKGARHGAYPRALVAGMTAVEIALSGFVIGLTALLTVAILQVVEHIFQVRELRADMVWLRKRVERLEGASELQAESAIYHGTHHWTAEDLDRGKRNAEILKAKGLL